MKMKKMIAWASAAVVAGCMMSGCSQTIIEHQFFTDQHTVTEIIESTVTPDMVPGLEELEKTFKEYDIDLVVQFPLFVDRPNSTPEEVIEGTDTVVTQDEIDEFIKNEEGGDIFNPKGVVSLHKTFNKDDGITGYIDTIDACAREILDELETYLESHPDALDKYAGEAAHIEARTAVDEDENLHYTGLAMTWWDPHTSQP